jgi:ketosteroid isomerase-like protein
MRGSGVVCILGLGGLLLAQSSSSTKGRLGEEGSTSGRLAQEVLAIKRQYDEAQLRNDSAWFEQMFAEDYIFVLPDSTVIKKAAFVNDLKSRDLVWESVSGKNMHARVYGDTAVVTGQFFGKGRFKGKALDERQFFTSIWIKRKGRWQAISEHASSLPPAGK